MSTTFSVRLDDDTKERLEHLSKEVGRAKTHLCAEAIKEYIDINEWQIAEIKKAVEAADKPDAKFIPHKDIEAWLLKSLGTPKERKPPKCG
ncbi:MAG: ribbon-helix-helix protein, CopG family [Nitrospirae bacterium]|nr:ribbon-helix-helix protein, CopG family [Nitrospirota bacterium]